MRRHQANRRTLLQGAATLSAGLATVTAGARPAAAQQQANSRSQGAGLPDPSSRQGEFAEVNGARIFHQSTGQGEPMLLLHGYPLSGALFARVRDGLATKHRVVTLDHRGYGRSEAPGTPDSIEVYSRDALAVMQRLGIERAAIGGMSMGGPIALSMYQQAPERFSSMMLIDTIAAPANAAEAGLWRGVAEMVRQNGLEAILPVLLKEMLTGETRASEPAQVQYLQAVMKQASREAAIGGATALAGRADFTSLLGQIRIPTLVYVGREDSVYPFEIARQMHEAIRGSKLEIIPGAAHAAIFEKPDPSVQAILRWSESMQGARPGPSR